jgi:[ribosomal protein S5]-alanine N-acetyltransferase
MTSCGGVSTPRIETPRLDGSPLADNNFADLRMLHADPRVAATLTVDGRPLSEELTRRFLARAAEHWRTYGFGLFGFCGRERGEFVGYCGIRHTIVEAADTIELMYAIRSEFWRMGFATEMARASVRFAFERAGIEELVAFTLVHNVGSRRVMESCGFRYQRDITHAGLPHVLYRLHRT